MEKSNKWKFYSKVTLKSYKGFNAIAKITNLPGRYLINKTKKGEIPRDYLEGILPF